MRRSAMRSCLLMVALLVAGCAREGSRPNPMAPGEATVQVTGKLMELSDGRPWDGELLLTVEVGPGHDVVAYRPGWEAPQGTPQVPFECEPSIEEFAVGDRVLVRGYVRGSRLLMSRLVRLTS